MAIKNRIKTENINCRRMTINLAQFTGSTRSRTKLLEVSWIAVRFFMHYAYLVQSLMWQKKDVLPHLMNDIVQWITLQHVVANNVAHYIERSKESKNTHLLNGRKWGLRWSKNLRYTKLKLSDVSVKFQRNASHDWSWNADRLNSEHPSISVCVFWSTSRSDVLLVVI